MSLKPQKTVPQKQFSSSPSRERRSENSKEYCRNCLEIPPLHENITNTTNLANMDETTCYFNISCSSTIDKKAVRQSKSRPHVPSVFVSP